MSMIIEMLRAHEGVETHAYKCTADKDHHRGGAQY